VSAELALARDDQPFLPPYREESQFNLVVRLPFIEADVARDRLNTPQQIKLIALFVVLNPSEDLVAYRDPP